MKKKNQIILTIAALLVVSIVLVAFTTPNKSVVNNSNETELTIDNKISKCGEGEDKGEEAKCGEADDKGEKCGEGDDKGKECGDKEAKDEEHEEKCGDEKCA